MKARHVLGLSMVTASVLAIATPTLAADVTAERLANATSPAEAGNWLVTNRTYDSNRYSPLTEITPDNVKNLKLAFSVPIGGVGQGGEAGVQMTPLANDGFLYVADQWGTPYKIDATSGKAGQIVWVCDTGVNKAKGAMVRIENRGLSLWGNLVITSLGDGRVVACDDATGQVAWSTQVTQNPGEGFEGTSLVVKDEVIVGQSNGDWATRGFLAAIDAKTGKEKWRFYTVPAPGEPGSETWKCDQTGNPDCWKTGGAAIWTVGSYDPDSNTIYWGTGNPVPMMDPEYRPGDNLYSDSTLALDADTGKLKWYFQYIPGDYMDYDAIGTQQLVNVKVDGQDRKMLAYFGRNGIFYTLDRSNGSFVAANQYIDKLTWTKGIDPKTGLPVEYNPATPLQVYAFGANRRGQPDTVTCPNQQGAVNQWPTALDPTTGIAYAAGMDQSCEHQTVKAVAPADVHGGLSFNGGSFTAEGAPPVGGMWAFDVSTGKKIASASFKYPENGGVSLTPGLVWTGFIDGTFGAYDAKTLKEAWSINLGIGFKTAPMMYSVNGKEYVAIIGGVASDRAYPELKGRPVSTTLYVFSL